MATVKFSAAGFHEIMRLLTGGVSQSGGNLWEAKYIQGLKELYRAIMVNQMENDMEAREHIGIRGSRAQREREMSSAC